MSLLMQMPMISPMRRRAGGALEPDRRRRRRRAAAWLLLACLLLGLDLLGWLQLQRLLDRRLADLVRQAQRSGWQFEVAGSRRGGWPLGATLTLAAPRLQGGSGLLPGLPAGLSWSAERVTVSLSPLHPRRVTILPGGVQVIAPAGHGASALGDSLRLWGRRMRLELPAGDDATGGAARLAAGGLRLVMPGAGQVVRVGALRGTLRWTGAARAANLVLDRLDLGPARGCGPWVPHAALELSLIGSGASGRMLLRQAALRWSGAMIDASGQARLDARSRAEGSFVVQVAGADRLLDGLAGCGRIGDSTREAMQAVLGLIGQARDDGPAGATATAGLPPAITLPLTLNAGLLSLGHIPLLQLPVLGEPDAVP